MICWPICLIGFLVVVVVVNKLNGNGNGHGEENEVQHWYFKSLLYSYLSLFITQFSELTNQNSVYFFCVGVHKFFVNLQDE